MTQTYTDRHFIFSDDVAATRFVLFEDCTFTGIAFVDTNFTGATFHSSQFTCCTFTNCDFTNVDWYRASGFIRCTWTDGTPGLVNMAAERANIQRMAETILVDPVFFDMLTWEFTYQPNGKNACLTTRCMGGWLLHLDGQQVFSDTMPPVDVSTRAARLAPHAAVYFQDSDEDALRWLETQIS